MPVRTSRPRFGVEVARSCHVEHLVAFSCKRRGFCPSCGARRMAESAALLVDEVFPEQPVRQWVLSVPYPLRAEWGIALDITFYSHCDDCEAQARS